MKQGTRIKKARIKIVKHKIKQLMRRYAFLLIALLPLALSAQIHWQNVDSLYSPLPPSVHVFYTNDSINGKPNIAYYVSAELKDKHLDFAAQIGHGKRFTPSQYFETDRRASCRERVSSPV